MQRLIRLCALLAAVFVSVSVSSAQNVIITGRVAPNEVRIFVRDSLYQISGTYVVAGTLIIEPGTTVEFLPNGSRIIDSVGGRILADGRARATYSGSNPASTPRQGGGFCYDFSDPAYFFSGLVLSKLSQIEPTIAPAKNDWTYHVVLDTLARRIENLPPPSSAPAVPGSTYPTFPTALNPAPGSGAIPPPNTYFPTFNAPFSAATIVGGNSFYNTKFAVPYEFAIMWIAARLSSPTLDPAIRTLSWRRFNFQGVNIGGAGRDRIRFVGKPVNNFSREWGHMIILPGARTAFFRDCDFENFRKDSTVDRFNIYQNAAAGDASTTGTLNNNLVSQTQGSGGVLSILSSRTWLVNCTFQKNMARYHGGAVQFLQAPIDPNGTTYPTVLSGAGTGAAQYSAMPASYEPTALGAATTPASASIIVNQYLYDHNANNTSTWLPVPRVNADPANPQPVRAHDNLYNNTIREMDDNFRQQVDDGRLAVYLGRIRQLTFTQNKVQNTNVRQTTTSQGVLVSDDEDNNAAIETNPSRQYKNDAWGGAVFISGRWAIDIGLGVNDFQGRDYVIFDGNMARNLQPQSTGAVSTRGARGGALYVSGFTSVTTTGRYRSNMTETKFITGYESAALNQGGAVFTAPNAGRFTLRGGQDVQVPMYMTSNSASRGGAIYSEENFAADPNRPSPHIGGNNSDNILVRNLGYNIKFQNNTAKYDGGAIFAKRNYLVHGAGGVVAGVLTGYNTSTMVEFSGNTAGYSGGAIAIHMRNNVVEPERGYLRLSRSIFSNNRVGENQDSTSRLNVRGGGALYVLNAELQVVRGVEFINNLAQWGNGGAVAMINPKASFTGGGPASTFQRVFCSDLDQVTFGANPAFVTGFTSVNDPFTFNPNNPFPPHVRMMTRFLDNRSIENPNRMGSGATQAGSITLRHPGVGVTTGPDAGIGGNQVQENGTGLGGGLYILDEIAANRTNRIDSVFFNRVRFQNQTAYTGSAIYSDNYDLKLVMLRSFVANNSVTSSVADAQNAITGPMITVNNRTFNTASSDLAGATLYGEVIGPVPFASYSTAGNSMYDNNARFLVRLPDAPNTKGVFAGTTGLGYGGTDTLRGNYWGRTEANLVTKVYRYDANGNPDDSVLQETFFVAGNGTQQLRYVRGGSGKDQGPFEQNSSRMYTYTPIPVLNGTDENTPNNTLSIPERLLNQGRVYDIFDKGTDIKTADFSKRRMSPIEDFAVGIPSLLRRFTNANQPSFNKYIKRWTRNPFDAEADANIAQLQTEYKGDHPIGYPLFLEAQSDYSFDPSLSNNDTRSINETVFFVINTSTGDYIRVNMAQTDLTSETFRARVDIVPDSTNGGQVTGGYQVRRNAEGLANFGTDLASILGSIKRNAENEDAGTLSARKYEANWSAGQLGGSGFTFSNRATMPSSNGNIETFFAGETYRTIPAKVGDQIAIVSRSVLWREAGASNDAFSGALMFRVGASTPPPVWTGNVPQVRFPLQANGSPVPVEFRNNLFVSEDRVYPRNANDNSRPPGRDTIMAITARDTNLFYNPISIINPTRKSQLEYGWSVEAGSGLANWLKADTIVAADPVNPWWQARGYVRLKGQPSNPYVVPGGEWVTVTARNYPPNFRTLDSMKANGIADSIIAKYHYLYSSYFSNQAYDGTNARWLQQDTVNYGWNADTVYRFRIFVTDSLPIFQNNIWACANGRGDTLFANLTDKLRFKADYNTDDESEDSVAATLGWTFPYGRTAYAFMSKNTQGIDTTVDQLSIVRPIWMQNRYLKKYSDGAVNDPLAVDFTSKGQINIVIDSLEAINILSPLNRQHSALNTDTVITVVANDGHGGITNFTRTIRVNVAPTILNDQLADAFEDEDYNIDLSIISPDSNKRIRVSDPNFGDNHTYELIYGNDPRKTAGIDRDGCFTEAGKWNIENANTPNWLKINPRSGLLYGTPRVLDTKLVDTTVTVTVLVTDQGRLTHVKTLQLRIVGRNHDPEITSAPNVRCVESGQSFTDSVWVRDIDLRRTETVNVAVLSPSGLTVEPATINGNRSSDSVRVAVKGNPFTVNPYVTEVRVRLRVTDANGGRPDTLEYTIKVSEQSRFTSRLRVANKQGAFEDLFWGTGANATTGDDAQAGGIGKLDSNYCEYELPPVPPFDVFDARWGIPSRNGTLRNFFPNCQTGSNRLLAYKGRFQSGGVNGQTTNYYPVTMTWNKDSVPARNNTQLNPCGGTWFLRDGVGGNLYNINMNTGVARVSTTSNYEVAVNGSEVTLTIKTDAVQSFEIVWDQATPVEAEEPVAGERAMITGITPNPFSGTSNVSFSLPTSNTISMNVYDALGNKVATLINNTLYGAGTHTIEWNALNSNGMELPSGTYTVRLSSGAINVVQRAVIVR